VSRAATVAGPPEPPSSPPPLPPAGGVGRRRATVAARLAPLGEPAAQTSYLLVCYSHQGEDLDPHDVQSLQDAGFGWYLKDPLNDGGRGLVDVIKQLEPLHLARLRRLSEKEAMNQKATGPNILGVLGAGPGGLPSVLTDTTR